jgi:hypothetical protein
MDGRGESMMQRSDLLECFYMGEWAITMISSRPTLLDVNEFFLPYFLT